MAYVFTPEIEAILAKGPPAIDWDGISEQLRRDFLRVCDSNGNRVVVHSTLGQGCADAGEDSSPGLFRPEVVSESSECREWSCLEGRARTCRAVAVVPSVTVGTGPIEDLVAVGKPWLTFSRESVAELNRMGIDEAYSVHGTVGATVSGAVVYRGSTDSESHVNSLLGPMFSRLAGSFKYVTAWASDESKFASATAHMFLNGGRVCGWSTAGATCYWCEDSGRVVHEYMSFDSGTVARGDHCLCSKGEWLSVRDDEEGEREFAGRDVNLMGWPSAPSPPRARSPVVVDLNQRFGGIGRPGGNVQLDREIYEAMMASGLAMGDDTVQEGPIPRWTDVLVRRDEVTLAGVSSVLGGGLSSGGSGEPVSAEPSTPDFTSDDGFEGMWEQLLSSCVSPLLLESVLKSDVSESSLSAEIVHWSGTDLPSPGSTDLFGVKPTSVWMADGWCYLMVIVPRYRDLVASRVGKWISVDGLLDLPKEWVSFNSMTKALCSVVAEGKLHVHSGSDTGVLLDGIPLFDELVGVATNPVTGRREGTFGCMLENAYPTGAFGGALVNTKAHFLLGTRRAAGRVSVGGFLRSRVADALVAWGARRSSASLVQRPHFEREVVGDFSFWGEGVLSGGFRPYALFPVPVASALGVYLPGVLWFDPAVPADECAVYPLSSMPGWPGEPVVDAERLFARAELHEAGSWKRLPVLVRNALCGGQCPLPRPLFPGMGVSWASGALGEHFSLLAGAWSGLFQSVVVTEGWYVDGVGPLALEPISGGIYRAFPGIHGGVEPECYVPPVHTWAPGTVVGELAMQWRRDHLR